MRSTIICVDDDKLILNLLYNQLEEWFGENYYIEKALNATEGYNILDQCLKRGRDVSVFISDYIMPITKGDELLTKVKERNPKIKRIMLTGYSAMDGIINAINKAGIYRYISKPWDSKDMMLTLLEAIKSYEQDKITYELSKNYETLYYKYQKLYTEKELKYNELLDSFSLACSTRTNEDSEKSKRIASYCEMLGEALNFDEPTLKNLHTCGILYNVGNTALKDDELNILKTEKPYSSEYNKVCMSFANHTNAIFENLSNSTEICDTIKYQFETFDGKGPFGLSKEEIPINARILHIARLYDDISSSMKGVSLKEIIVEFVSIGKTYLDNHLTSLFIKQLQNKAY